MNNHRDLLGIILNVLFAVLILAIIILGLNRMGLYNLPEQIENFIFSSEKEQKEENVDDSQIYNTVEYDENKYSKVEKTAVTYENARQLLSSVVSAQNYHHEVVVSRKNEGAQESVKVILKKQDGLYNAELYSIGGKLLKMISEKDGKITVKEYQNGYQVREFTHPAGNFTVTELAGVVVDHENFLSGDYELSEGEFSVIQGDFGIELEIVFDTVMENYTQHEVYRINVDYGMVTKALCYENELLVYELETYALRELN